MTREWEEQIFDPTERRVWEALSDPAWDFRTIDGISKATGLPESEVRAILEKYPDLHRKSAVPDQQGRELFTLRSRPVKIRERVAFLRTLVTKSIR